MITSVWIYGDTMSDDPAFLMIMIHIKENLVGHAMIAVERIGIWQH